MDCVDNGSGDGIARALDQELGAVREWMGSERFTGITRVHTARQVIEQRGTVCHGLHRRP